MRARHSITAIAMIAVFAAGIIGAEPPVVPDERALAERANALRQRIQELETEKAKIDAQLDAARRALDRVRPIPRPEPRRELRELMRPPRRERRTEPDVQNAPSHEQLPPGSVPGEINGLRFYVIPLRQAT